MAKASDVKRALAGDRNLSGADLSGAYLSRANLSGANLSGANLSGASLSDANLSGADLSGADLTEANLSYAKLSGADLSGANLTAAKLTAAKLTAAKLTAAKLIAAEMDRAVFDGANMRKAQMDGAYLIGADLTNTRLKFASMTDATLTDATLTDAWMREAKLDGAGLIGAGLLRADLTRASLRGAYLTNAELVEADLTGADLTGANLFRAIGVNTAPASAASKGKQSTTGRLLLGFVLNPKNGRVVAATLESDHDIKVVSPDGQTMGAGYFERYYGDLSSNLTGLTRAHTAQGVDQKSAGYGTSLYTAINLCAHLFYNGILSSSNRSKVPTTIGDGISSYHCEDRWSRSDEAREWWQSANTKHCMTKRLIAKPGNHPGVTGDTGYCRVDAYYYDRAKQLGLVLLEATEPIEYGSLDNPASLVGKLKVPSKASARNIVGADWGGMARECGEAETMALLSAFAQILKSQKLATKADVEGAAGRLASKVSTPPKPAKKKCVGGIVRSFKTTKKVSETERKRR